MVFLAAGSDEQRDEWFNLLGHFADKDRRKGPLPKSAAILSPRTGGGTEVVDAIKPAEIPMVVTQKEPPGKTLKPILKTKPSQTSSAPVPAIRIPRRMPNDPMEASGESTRRSSIRFSDDVEKLEFAVLRADPVPQNMRAHESRRQPAVSTGSITARTADGQPVEVRQRTPSPPARPAIEEDVKPEVKQDQLEVPASSADRVADSEECMMSELKAYQYISYCVTIFQ